MRKPDFDHLIAVSASITGEDEIVVIGSQAILGSFVEPPESLVRSIEVDLFPRADPAKAEDIDGAIGDGSQFHATYGYYAHGVGPETAKGPAGWEDRLVRVEVSRRPGREGTVFALCLEVHDLILAKCAAGRERDWEFAEVALRAGIVDLPRLLDAVEDMPLDQARRAHVTAMLEGVGSRLT